MKKLFTILAVASMMLTSVFGFTSCQKDDVPVTQSYNTTTPANKTVQDPTNDNKNTTNTTNDTKTTDAQYYTYQIFLSDAALQYSDIVVTANYDGKTETYKVSEGQSVTYDFAKNLHDKNITTFPLSGKKLIIPAFKSSTQVQFNFVVTTNSLPTDGTKIDVALAVGYAKGNSSDITVDLSKEVNQANIKTNIFVSKGFNATALTNYLIARASHFTKTF